MKIYVSEMHDSTDNESDDDEVAVVWTANSGAEVIKKIREKLNYDIEDGDVRMFECHNSINSISDRFRLIAVWTRKILIEIDWDHLNKENNGSGYLTFRTETNGDILLKSHKSHDEMVAARERFYCKLFNAKILGLNIFIEPDEGEAYEFHWERGDSGCLPDPYTRNQAQKNKANKED